MISKDSLLKLLKQWDEAQKKLNSSKNEGDIESALQIIRESYVKLLKMKVTEYEGSAFLDSLFKEKTLGLEELNVLAGLLKEEGDIYYEQEEDQKSLLKYRQALEVFDYLNREEKVFSFERESKISLMQERVHYLES